MNVETLNNNFEKVCLHCVLLRMENDPLEKNIVFKRELSQSEQINVKDYIEWFFDRETTKNFYENEKHEFVLNLKFK